MKNWKVMKNPIGDDYFYQVYRIIDEREPLHAGNIEKSGGLFDDREEAQAYADDLNEVGA